MKASRLSSLMIPGQRFVSIGLFVSLLVVTAVGCSLDEGPGDRRGGQAQSKAAAQAIEVRRSSSAATGNESAVFTDIVDNCPSEDGADEACRKKAAQNIPQPQQSASQTVWQYPNVAVAPSEADTAAMIGTNGDAASSQAKSQSRWGDLNDHAAFPGAEGFGRTTIGGRGGKVLVVDRLADDRKPGSLRHALEEVSGPRIVVFAVGGYITLQSNLTIEHPFVTIAGQTAPGGGITIRGGRVSIKSHDVVMRYLRLRLGTTTGSISDCDPDSDDCTWDTLTVEKSQNIVFDHCSFSWSVDEVISGVSSKDVTIQYSIISDPLRLAEASDGKLLHNEQHAHPYCSLFRGSDRVSFHHNIYANCGERPPQVGTKGEYAPDAVIAYNFIYNHLYKGTKLNISGSTPFHKVKSARLAIVDNLYQPLKAAPPAEIEIELDERIATSVFINGNYDMTAKESASRKIEDIPSQITYLSKNPHDGLITKASDVLGLKAYLLSEAGSRLPARDSFDKELIQSIHAAESREIDSEQDLGGFPQIAIGQQALDSDGDGMPDSWEIQKKLNPEGDDSSGHQLNSFYTNIEVYLAELASR